MIIIPMFNGYGTVQNILLTCQHHIIPLIVIILYNINDCYYVGLFTL